MLEILLFPLYYTLLLGTIGSLLGSVVQPYKIFIQLRTVKHY